MPSNRSRSRSSRSKSRGRRGRSSNPNASSLSYRGPIVTRTDKTNANTITVLLNSQEGVTSSAGGVINNVAPLNNPAAANNWSDFAGAWDEFRVLASEIVFVPQNKYNKLTTTLCIPIIGVLDRDSSGALTSYAQGVNYASVKYLSLEEKFSFRYSMQGAREAVFETTASPASTGAFLLYGSGLTASTAYGTLFQRWRVQFRGTI
jgi:hypothetical protein